MLNPSPFLPAKQRIRQAFDQAAMTYDGAADVQREVSDRLTAHLIQTSGNLNPKAGLAVGKLHDIGIQIHIEYLGDGQKTILFIIPDKGENHSGYLICVSL